MPTKSSSSTTTTTTTTSIAAAATNLSSIKNQAEKQLETMIKSMSSLTEVPWHKFQRELKINAEAYNWPAHILDPSANAPDYNDDTNIAHAKAKLDVRNAFLVMINKTKGHVTEDRLEDIEMMDVQAAYKALRDHYNSSTLGGKLQASTNFHTASMASLDVNIIQWIAAVSRLCNALNEVSDRDAVTDEEKLTLLMRGLLLPDFLAIKNILNHRPGITTGNIFVENL